jgi:hypothetical protein
MIVFLFNPLLMLLTVLLNALLRSSFLRYGVTMAIALRNVDRFFFAAATAARFAALLRPL